MLVREGIGIKEKQEKVTKELEGVLETIFQNATNRKTSIKSTGVLDATKANQPASMEKLANFLGMSDDDLAINHSFPMRERGEITWDGPKNNISSMSAIRIDSDPGESKNT